MRCGPVLTGARLFQAIKAAQRTDPVQRYQQGTPYGVAS